MYTPVFHKKIFTDLHKEIEDNDLKREKNLELNVINLKNFTKKLTVKEMPSKIMKNMKNIIGFNKLKLSKQNILLKSQSQKKFKTPRLYSSDLSNIFTNISLVNIEKIQSIYRNKRRKEDIVDFYEERSPVDTLGKVLHRGIRYIRKERKSILKIK
ncbi:MAG: hypothetical protein MJ252_14500 [archaeon]|nr:hypothetical protein [archaeon]